MFWCLLFMVLCEFAVADVFAQLDQHWELWKKMHNKVYSHEIEEMGHRHIWEGNLELISIHNLEASLGLHSYELAMNHLGDLTTEEIDQTLAGTIVPENLERTPVMLKVDSSVPQSLDWRTKGLVTNVKKQGQCGACWAFSAVGSLEGQLKKTTGVLLSLSTQNLVDCSRKYGSHGCKGGFMTHAFRYIKDHGLETEVAYPYTGQLGECKYNPEHRVANCSGYICLPEGDEASLKLALATVGPIAVAVDSSRHKFRFYHHGVYRDPTCSHKVDHGVLAVGYGTEKGEDYWLIKNSWGRHFGDEGYIKMARNANDQCGVSRFGCFPIV
ncbi:cathepsin S-like [Thalassophryne amazonica]|uniref:cathepsin S-like n=1 Tax=Thalassophryne amazonica TaxID=390379 RepID=UPI0014721329|nr:cathepsin S-like [Thalassophryne amazonica]